MKSFNLRSFRKLYSHLVFVSSLLSVYINRTCLHIKFCLKISTQDLKTKCASQTEMNTCVHCCWLNYSLCLGQRLFFFAICCSLFRFIFLEIVVEKKSNGKFSIRLVFTSIEKFINFISNEAEKVIIDMMCTFHCRHNVSDFIFKHSALAFEMQQHWSAAVVVVVIENDSMLCSSFFF